jgi:5-methylcytosine-specific restriction endonuclease McrA
MADIPNTAEHECAQCGEALSANNSAGRSSKYCSKRCRGRAQEAKRAEKRNADRRAVTKARLKPTPCRYCGASFLPSFISQSMYCSKRCCKMAHWQRTHGTLHERVRQEAAALKRIAKKRPGALLRMARLADRKAAIYHRRKHCCAECGITIGTGDLRTVYCDGCAEIRRAAARRADKQRYKVLRRTRLKATTVELFDPIEVLERDGWRCHICGIRTPRRLRGSYEDNAPELDHVIPLAAGGEHSRKNTACSCRKCNIAKADRPLGQLRLVA